MKYFDSKIISIDMSVLDLIGGGAKPEVNRSQISK